MITADTRLIDLTIADLSAIIRQEVSRSMSNIHIPVEEKKEEILTGISGLATALHCSNSTAQRMKQQHMLDGGFIQYGAKIIIKDAEALRQIAAQAKLKKRKRVI